MSDTTEDQPFAEWAILEQLGHRRYAGHVTETTIAGAGFLRVDIPASDKHPAQTHLIEPKSVYALHPVTEAVARAAAERYRPEPVSRWDLRAIEPAPPRMLPEDYDEADHEGNYGKAF